MKTVKTFEEFVNEKFTYADEYELRDFLVKNVGIKPFHIESYVFLDTKGNNRKDELLAMFKNAGTPEKLEKFYHYIMTVIVPASSTLKKYLK